MQRRRAFLELFILRGLSTTIDFSFCPTPSAPCLGYGGQFSPRYVAPYCLQPDNPEVDAENSTVGGLIFIIIFLCSLSGGGWLTTAINLPGDWLVEAGRRWAACGNKSATCQSFMRPLSVSVSWRDLWTSRSVLRLLILPIPWMNGQFMWQQAVTSSSTNFVVAKDVVAAATVKSEAFCVVVLLTMIMNRNQSQWISNWQAGVLNKLTHQGEGDGATEG